MNILDDLEQIKKSDKSKMADFIAEFPQKCMEAYKKAQEIILPKDYQDISVGSEPASGWENIIICGMGGSAISGELIKNLLAGQLKKPVIVNRNWFLPDLTTKNSLVILISYSGETKEVLSCARMAMEKKNKIFIIAQAGRLKKLGEENDLPMFNFSYPVPSRAGLAYLLMPLLVVFEKLGLINSKCLEINSSLNDLQNFNLNLHPQIPTEENSAKYLAYSIFDHLPIIIAPPELSGVAHRWKTQMAENGKSFCFSEVKPEILHNFIESRFPWRLNDEFFFLVFDDIKKIALSEKSSETFENMLEQKNCWKKLPVFGQNILTKIFSLVLLGDWVSFYLAVLYQVDPTPVKQIEKIKKCLND